MCDPSRGRTVGTSELLWTVMTIQVCLPKKPEMLLTLTSSELISGAQAGWVTVEVGGPLEGNKGGLES